MRILGVDFGDSRIGIAISDPFGWTSGGVETINWSGDITRPIEKISTIVAEYGVEKIVVGMPRNMNGTYGPRSEITWDFIRQLEQKTGLEVIPWDERLTTAAASRIIHELGYKTKDKKHVMDQMAAAQILQGYLDNIRRNDEMKG
ncbi:MAG: Holliday junction resolvase RuvX [Clostridiales bacterium]|nr:Holliday junction resolvase RuvX [Clostridiales bacterium]